MRKNAEKAITAFFRSTPAKGDSKSSIWTDGERLYSYNTMIAFKVRQADGRYQVHRVETYNSVTTRSQLQALAIFTDHRLRMALAGVVKYENVVKLTEAWQANREFVQQDRQVRSDKWYAEGLIKEPLSPLYPQDKCPTGYTWPAHQNASCNCVSRQHV